MEHSLGRTFLQGKHGHRGCKAQGVRTGSSRGPHKGSLFSLLQTRSGAERRRGEEKGAWAPCGLCRMWEAPAASAAPGALPTSGGTRQERGSCPFLLLPLISLSDICKNKSQCGFYEARVGQSPLKVRIKYMLRTCHKRENPEPWCLPATQSYRFGRCGRNPPSSFMKMLTEPCLVGRHMLHEVLSKMIFSVPLL